MGRTLLLGCRLALGFCCGGMTLMELPHRWPGDLPPVKHAGVYVIGDSISAGIEEHKPNWPGLLQQQCRARIINLARPAATLNTGLKQAAQIPDEPCLILIELGGNDLLNRVSATQFEKDLQMLLSGLRKPGRTLVMLELPLLPGQLLLGRIQRSTAAAHTCYLIPKRFFAGILAGPEATVDGLHLSEQGHQAMARVVKEQVGSLLED